MKNFTDPIQEKQNFVPVFPGYKYRTSLFANKFEDFTDKIGLFRQDPVEYSFL